MQKTAQEAINAALSGNWNEALTINLKIVKNNSQDIDALNRLAQAYAKVGKVKLAQQTTKKVLKIDPYNKIAQKSREKWKNFSTRKDDSFSVGIGKKQLFLEEPGKTKIVKLINLGDQKIIVQLTPGDEVGLVCHQHRVSVANSNNRYVGRLPDDLSSHLRKLIKCGNAYETIIKSADKEAVRVFIRETKQAKIVKNIISFPLEKINYVAFTPPELIHNNN